MSEPADDRPAVTAIVVERNRHEVRDKSFGRTRIEGSDHGHPLQQGDHALELRHGHELKARIVSLQYSNGPVLPAPRNTKAFEWNGKSGNLKELEQKLTLGRGDTKHEVQAKFEAKKNQTTIKVKDLVKTKVVRPGLVLLRLATTKGSLIIEF